MNLKKVQIQDKEGNREKDYPTKENWRKRTRRRLPYTCCTINAEIFMVIIFHKLNFRGDKFLRVSVAFTVANYSSVQIFVGAAGLRKLILNENFCVYGRYMQ